MNPRYSIVIPCYNAARFIGESIRSCLAQTDGDLEVLVVDDGSTDDSAATVAALAGDTRVRLIRQSNQGVGAARNAGLAAARGEFINFLDADDLLEPEKLALQGRLLAENPEFGLVLCDGRVIDADGRVTTENLIEPRRFSGLPPLFDVLFGGGQFPPLVPLLRRSLALEAGGFSTDRAVSGWADTGFWLRVAQTGPRYGLIDKPLCRYRSYAGNMSSDASAMETAARAVYAEIMLDQAALCARSLRALQRRLDDAEAALGMVRGAVMAADERNKRLDRDLAQAHALLQQRRMSSERIAAAELSHTLASLAALAGAPHPRPIVIWGSGSGGRRVLALLQRTGTQPAAFIDSDPAKAGTTVEHVPIHLPDAIKLGNTAGAFVVVASVHAAEITTRLHTMGLQALTDYLTIDFAAVALLEKHPGNGSL